MSEDEKRTPVASEDEKRTPVASEGEKRTLWHFVQEGMFIIYFCAWILVGLYAVPDSRPFVVQWWWQIAVGIFVFTAVVTVLRWFRQTTTAVRTGVIYLVVFPVLVGLMIAIVFLPQTTQIILLRLVFLIAVCLLPPVIYYLFIATRKIGLLNDYFLNLGRLGLLEPQPTAAAVNAQDATTKCRVRRLNCVQKFEAIYGPLPQKLADEIITSEDPLAVLVKPDWRPSFSSTIEEVFTPQTGIPVLLATILIALGWLLALPPNVFLAPAISTADQHPLWSVIFSVNEDPIIYAFLGAYFFSLQMLFRRYVREDLRKSAYVAVSLRIILAVIGTWAVVTAMKSVGYKDSSHLAFPVLGFVIGVFPRVAWQFIQGATKTLMSKFASGVLPSIESRLPLSDLDGLTVWHESRLEEEDIENIPNMANAEIVDLMISTRFSPDRIIDWVDQAILFTHLGPDQEKDRKDGVSSRRDLLRLQGIYTATSLIKAFEKAQSSLRKDAQKVETILCKASGGHIRSIIDVIKMEPNLDLIYAWRGIQQAEPGTEPAELETKPAIAPVELVTKTAA